METLRIRDADIELKDYLKALLTIINPPWVDAQSFGRYTGNIPKYIYQFEEDSDGNLEIPRGLLSHLLQDLGREWGVEDLRVSPRAAWPEGNITLRLEDQEPAVENALLQENGFLSAPAGSGKTIMGLEICRRLGLKALWLTHRNELKDQTIQEAVDLFGFDEKDIGVLHGSKWKVGEVLTVGMIPTLRRRDLAALRETFGVVIIDEAHHVPSTTFLKVATQFNCRYLYGLTATAYRRDRLESVMFNAIGFKVAEIKHTELVEDEHLILPTVKIRRTGWLPAKVNTMEYPDFMEAMVKDVGRNRLIAQDILAECQQGHPCIVLVQRTDHAEIITDMLQKMGVLCEYAVGSVSVKSSVAKGRKNKRKKRVIPKKVRARIVSEFKSGKLQALITTYELLKEGFNYRPLNRLFMAAPIKWRGSVVQSLGRIQRTAEGKTDAVAYDYVDSDILMFARQAESRKFSVYRRMGMKIQE